MVKQKKTLENVVITEETRQKQLDKIAQFRAIDDEFFEVLANDEAFCQEILRVILEDDELVVLKVTVQKDVRNLVGRSVRVDALCKLSDGRIVNVEVQRSNDDNHLKRIRYNAACITASVTETGTKFENVPDVIVVFISEFDFLKGNRTKYHIDKVVRETGEVIYDGTEVICVNTKIKDGTDTSELMSCFVQTEVDNPKFPIFTNRMKYFKHSEGGRREMSDLMKELLEDYVDEVMQEKISNAIRKGLNVKDIADIFNVDESTVEAIEEEMLVK